MADLPVIGLGAFTDIARTFIVGSEPVLQVIGSASDANYAHTTDNTTNAAVASFQINGFPGDLGNVDTLSIRLRYHWQTGSQVNTWTDIKARIFRADGVTPLTNEVTVAGPITTTTPTNSAVINFTGVDTAATAADWEGAVLHITWDVIKNKGGDVLEKRVTAGELTGTYTVASGGTVEGAATLGASAGVTGAASATRDVSSILPAQASLTGLAQLIAQVAAHLGISADLALDLRSVLFSTAETGPWTPFPWDSWSDTEVAVTPDESVPTGTVWWRVRTRDGTDSNAVANTVATGSAQGAATLAVSAGLTGQAAGILQGAVTLAARADAQGSTTATIQALSTLVTQASAGSNAQALAIAEAVLGISAVASGQADQAIIAAATLASVAAVSGQAMASAVAAATLGVIAQKAGVAREESFAAGNLAAAATYQAAEDAAQDAAAVLGVIPQTQAEAVATRQAQADLAASGALTALAREDGTVAATLQTQAGLIGIEGSGTIAAATLAALTGISASPIASMLAQGAVIAALGLQGQGRTQADGAAAFGTNLTVQTEAKQIAHLSAILAVAMQLTGIGEGGASVTLPSGQVIRIKRTATGITVSREGTTITVQSDGTTITVKR